MDFARWQLNHIDCFPALIGRRIWVKIIKMEITPGVGLVKSRSDSGSIAYIDHLDRVSLLPGLFIEGSVVFDPGVVGIDVS
mgnify:CR=1 FL=1